MPTRTTLLLLFLLSFHRTGLAAYYVEPVYTTGSYPNANADSPAVWVSTEAPDESLLFVTEKDLDRVEVWYAATGLPHESLPFLGGEVDSSEPGQFNRPNGVWILYHVPFRETFCDILLVTDQRNTRVQIFRLPELTYFGEFANDDLGKPYGFASYHDGTDIFIYVTDAVETQKVKRYRLVERGEVLGAELLATFGEESGPGAFRRGVESMVADPVHNRLHLCGDEGGDFIHVFDLEGRYTGITYGEPEFQYDQEGIVLYDTGAGQGYLIASDQYRGGNPNEFEVFDRVSLESLGHFECPRDAPLITSNTDGAYLSQRPLLGFPNGAFFAVNDDKDTHAYDWTDIAEAMDLEIVPLDRPFALGTTTRQEKAGRSLWYHDSSW